MKDFKLSMSRKARDAEIEAFAREFAGTSLDLDTDLEAAGVEHLLQFDEWVPPTTG